MKRSTQQSILTIAILLWVGTLFGQKMKYDILLFGNKIGETIVERKDSLGTKHYSLKSNSQAKFLFINKTSCMSTDAFFDQDGKMFSSFFQNVKDDGKMLTKALWNQGKLLINNDGKMIELPELVNFSSLSLYFNEPKNLQKVFSERMGQFFEVIKKADGFYTSILDGNTTTYRYKNGKLVRLEIKGALGSVCMLLTE